MLAAGTRAFEVTAMETGFLGFSEHQILAQRVGEVAGDEVQAVLHVLNGPFGFFRAGARQSYPLLPSVWFLTDHGKFVAFFNRSDAYLTCFPR